MTANETIDVEKAVSFLEMCVLKHMAGKDAPFGITETYYFFRAFDDLKIPKDMLRALLRGLTDKGFCRYRAGLFTEDGITAGAGYAITGCGLSQLKKSKIEMVTP
jgi:hypothetical protein